MLVVLKTPGKFLHLLLPSLTASFRYPVLIRLCPWESMCDQGAWAHQLFPQDLPTGHHSPPMVPCLTRLITGEVQKRLRFHSQLSLPLSLLPSHP